MDPQDISWAVADGEPLLARIYEPTGDTPNDGWPVVVDVHGGSWSALDRTVGVLYDTALADAGFWVLAIDFRHGPNHRHPDGSADVCGAVRWVRANAEEYDLNPDAVGLVGSSSGGHLAMLAALTPEEDEHATTAFVDDGVSPEIDASVSCVAALWPPADPLVRFRYATAEAAAGNGDDGFHPDLLVLATTAYFGDEATMAEASVASVIRFGIHTHLPPLWVCRPELDRNVPTDITEALAAAWSEAGGEVAMSDYEGQAHGFGHLPSEATTEFIDELTSFLDHHLR